MGGLRLRRLAAAANVSYLVDIRVFLIKGRLRYRSRCGKNLTCTAARCGTADVRLWHQPDMPTALRNVCFSNRPFGVKRFQTIHHHGVDVSHGLVLLSGIGTKALVW